MQYATEERSQGICPNGWHIPSLVELEILQVLANHDANSLKEIGQDIYSTNSTGFTLLLAGHRSPEPYRDTRYIGEYTSIWSSTETSGGLYASYLNIWANDNSFYYNNDGKEFGLSIRCLKDENYGTTGQPCPGIPTVTDQRDGKVYNTVQVGSQCWLKENLDIGTRINGSQDQTNNSTIEKYCYNDDPANCTTYGGLYKWDEAMQYVTTPGATGICPEGWHIPNYTEYEILSAEVGGDGNALKEIDQGTGTNTSGFSALLAGYHSNDGNFTNLGETLHIWSSTEYSSGWSYNLYLDQSTSNINLNSDVLKIDGISIRCLKD